MEYGVFKMLISYMNQNYVWNDISCGRVVTARNKSGICAAIFIHILVWIIEIFVYIPIIPSTAKQMNWLGNMCSLKMLMPCSIKKEKEKNCSFPLISASPRPRLAD